MSEQIINQFNLTGETNIINLNNIPNCLNGTFGTMVINTNTNYSTMGLVNKINNIKPILGNVTLSTSDIPEGTNFYFSDFKINNNSEVKKGVIAFEYGNHATAGYFKIGNGILTTSDISEGTNFYYTDSKVNNNLNVIKGVIAFEYGNHATAGYIKTNSIENLIFNNVNSSTLAFFDNTKKLISITGEKLGSYIQTLSLKDTISDSDTFLLNDSGTNFESKRTSFLQLKTYMGVADATNITKGVSKLYSNVGSNTDGSMTQASISTLLLSDFINIIQTNHITLPDFTNQEKITTGFSRTWKITGNNIHNITLPSNWKNIRPDYIAVNNKTNYIFAQAIDGNVLYSVYLDTLPNSGDSVSPNILSISTDYSGYKIIIICDELIMGTGIFSVNGNNTIISQTISGNIITITLANQILYGSVDNTLSYVEGITDKNNNPLLSFTNNIITNNTANNIKSLSGGILTSNINPSKFAFCSGAGGTDYPFSVSFWIKRTSNNINVNFGANLTFFKMNINSSDNKVSFYLVNGSIGLFKSISAPALNVWTHYCFTYSGNKSISGMNGYVNGAFISSSGVTFGGTYTGGVNTSTLTITGSPNAIHDELAIWSSELTASEVSQIYATGITSDARLLSFAPSKLKGYFKYDNDILDLSASPVTLSGTPIYSIEIPS